MNKLVTVFEDTLKIGKEEFGSEIKNMLSKTSVISKRSNLQDNIRDAKVTFELGTSVSKVFKYGNDMHCAVLNFADGLEPGGLVKVGATTQEESLCRASTLYYSLKSPVCKEQYYDFNKPYGYLCSDRFIYSEDVIFFKDDQFARTGPVACDVITAPAPVASTCTITEYIDRVLERMIMYLGYSRIKGVELVILGAWGCGAFGGDSVVIGRCFKTALLHIGGFKKIVFTALDDATLQRLYTGFSMEAYTFA